MKDAINRTVRKILGSETNTSGKADSPSYSAHYSHNDHIFFSADGKEMYGRVTQVYPAVHHYMSGKEIDIVRMFFGEREHGPVYSDDKRLRHATHTEIRERRKAERRMKARGLGNIPSLEALINLAFGSTAQAKTN